ncbi:MAG: BACON domain-containing protein [Muribaculaceae bacterium]|nr:BACON domain-containing protein [Muribaculaceae bacterium]
MKLRNLFSIVVLIAVGLLSSCGENDGPSLPSGGDGGMSVNDEVLFTDNTSFSINIKASTKPVLTTDAAWLHIGEVKNLTTGIYTVELRVDLNDTGETRTAEVYVTTGKEKSTIKVTQVFSDLVKVTNVSPDGNLDANGGTFTIKYVSTAPPATNIPDWIKIDNTRSIDEGILSLIYLPNDTGNDREGLIVLAVGKSVANVIVRQEAR